MIFFLKKIYFVVGCTGTLLLCAGFSLVAASRGYSLVVVCRFLIDVATLVTEHRL